MESVLSVIIPAYNEERWLPRLLASIADARTVSAAGAAPIEVIVADNGSTDRTGEVAREHGATVVDVPTRGIAAARNAGARVATAPIVAFVDADSHLHPESFVAVLSAMEDRACIGGSTGVTVEVWSIPLRILQAMTLPFRLIGIDSGLVFCRREDFDALNGYDQSRLVGEDVDFLLRLRRHGAGSGRRMRRLRGVETITSTRKLDTHGHWRFLGIMAKSAALKALAPERFGALVRRYWYEDR